MSVVYQLIHFIKIKSAKTLDGLIRGNFEVSFAAAASQQANLFFLHRLNRLISFLVVATEHQSRILNVRYFFRHSDQI